jgi:outer membrane biogenesis lipoprotein LolB
VRAALLALALALLAGCAAVPPASPPPVLATVPKAFEMSARLSIRQGDRSDIARLRWTHRAQGDEWVFSSPIGNEVARIESGPSGARLARAGGPGDEAPSFQALTEKVLGVPLDPAELNRWLHGQGARTGVPAEWNVTIDEKQAAGAIELAKRVTATRGDIVVKLVVDQYRVLEE